VFLDQIGSTGTPWGDPQFPWVVVPRALIAFAGSEKDGEAYILAFLILLLPLLAVFGKAIDRHRIELDLRTNPPVRWEAAAAFGVLLVGAAISYVTDTTFAPRYAATIYPLVALVAAYGITVFLDARLRIGVLVLIALLGIAGGLRNVTYERTQAGHAAAVIADEAQDGDVVAYCSDQLGPDVSRLLEDVDADLTQITFPDSEPPQFVNWSDYLERARAADPAEFARDAIERAGDHTVWFVWSGGLNHLERECATIGATLDAARKPIIRVFPEEQVLEIRALTEYRP
jgi:hypothetical protein